MHLTTFHSAVTLFAGMVSGAACPFAMLRDAGILDARDAAAYEAVKRDPANADAIIKAHQPKRDISDDFSRFEERDLLDDLLGGLEELTLGGGLIQGILQPLSGPLQALDIPVPQPQGLKEIPGRDPNHQFQAPGPTDQRGLCPTLNTLANHGYISRNGITTFAEAANAVQTAYGFDYPLSVFLSALAVIAGGDLISGKYSIGGADSRVPNTLGPALGLGKHGVFEVDTSITREDTYLGNNANFILQRWDEYVAISKKHGGLFGRSTQVEDLGLRYDNSRATNPQFFAGAIWFVVSRAERVFVYTGLPNGTTVDIADYANIAPFFLNETFPERWFRRPEPWTLPSTAKEAALMFLENPTVLPGANEGLDNFIPFDFKLNLEKTPGDLVCFAIENIFDLVPGQLQTTISNNLDIFTGFLKGIVLPFIKNDGFFNCDFKQFVKPSPRAGQGNDGSYSSSGSPVNGAYPGVGVIKPDSNPSK